MEAQLKLKKGNEVFEDVFLRRSYGMEQDIIIDLEEDVKTAVDINLDDIQFLFVTVIGDDAVVSIYRNLSPECWQFSEKFIAWEIEDCSSLSLKADADTRVRLFVAGE